MKYFILRFMWPVLSLFFVHGVFAQSVRVLDAETGQPVAGVSIHEKGSVKNVITADDGVADLSLFTAGATLIFSRISYEDLTIPKHKFTEKQNTLYLYPEDELMETVILTVSRSKEKRSRVAEQVEVMNLQKRLELAPPSTAELLDNIPGIKVQKSQMGGGSPILRGMEANRVLLVVDGIRMNNAIYRKGHIHNSITLSPDILEKTEVLFGPSSIIYGSDALGGVIYYHTLEPKFKEKGGFHSSVYSRYGSANQQISASYTGALSSEKFASITSFSFSKFGDLQMGKNRFHGFDNWGLVREYSANTPEHFEADPRTNPNPELQKNTGYRQGDFLQKFKFKLLKGADVTFNFQYSESSDIPRFDKLTEYKNGTLKYAEWYYGPQKRFLGAAKIHLNPQKKWMRKGDIIFAYQNIHESRFNRTFGSIRKYERNERVRVFSINGDFHVPVIQDDKRILSYGFEIMLNDVLSRSLGRELEISGEDITGTLATFPVQTRYPDGGSTYNTFALYSDYRIGHSRQGTLNLGVRYTYTALQSKWLDMSFISLPANDISLDNSAISGTIGYIWKPNDNWQINSVLSSGFRSPNIDDIGKIREKKGKVSVPNIGLKPEYAFNAETGVIKFFKHKKIHLEANLYYTLIHRYITRDYFMLNGQEYIEYDGEQARIIANVNKGNAYIYGGTLGMSARWDSGIRLKTSHTYTYGQTLDTDLPLSSIPPLFGNIETSFRYNNWIWGAVFRYNAHKPAERYNVLEGIDNLDETPLINPDSDSEIRKYYGSPSWWTAGLWTKYRISDNADLVLRIDNIFDAHYKEFASGVSAPGRNLSLTAMVRF